MQLDEHPCSVRAQLDAGDHPKQLFEAERAALRDGRGVEEMPLRGMASLREPDVLQVGLVLALDYDGLEHRHRVTHDDVDLLSAALPDIGLGATHHVPDGARLEDP